MQATPAPAVPASTLVVDLDGTLTPTDTLVESVVALVRRSPWMVFAIAWWLLAGRAGFKAKVASAGALSVEHLPWNEPLLAWLRQQRAAGRRVVLATAAHESIALAVARHLDLFDDVLATKDGHNLKGANKLAALRARWGDDFVYAGDSRADLAVWPGARAAVLVGVAPAVRKALGATPIEAEFPRPRGGLRTWLKAMRVHQWVKNVLVFVPLLTGFDVDRTDRILPAVLAFLAFCLAASATYMLNDLWDLENDRDHPRKKLRPFASGALSIPKGVAATGVLLLAGLAVAWAVSPLLLALLVGYVVLTTAYSWVLKAYVLMDVVALACLYTYRVLCGAAATGIVVTPWLLAFSVFVFFSLALVKRCAELVTLQQRGRTTSSGRDYRVSDLTVLWPLGVGASLCSVVIFGLYLGTPAALAQYRGSLWLWLVGVGLIYWISRMWIKTSRGEMDDDPIVFAFKDRGSRLALLLMVCVPLLARLFAG